MFASDFLRVSDVTSICPLDEPILMTDLTLISNGQMPQKVSFGVKGINYYDAPDLPFIQLKEMIESILSQIEGLRYDWNEEYFIWNIEWGTRPFENSLDYKSFNTVKLGRIVSMEAASKAIELFPHNVDWDYNGIPIEQAGSWHKSELHVYCDPKRNKVFIQINRMVGCHNSFWNIWSQIKTALDTHL